MNNKITLCDNVRLIELASELHNMYSKMDLTIFILDALTEHLHDSNDSRFELGDYASIFLFPTEGVVELATRCRFAGNNNYQFYGIKDWTLENMITISYELSEIIDQDIHSDPHEVPNNYYWDISEL